MSESWLDCLKEHSIFELTAEEKKYADSLKQNQTSTSDINFSQHTSVIAFKDNILYFAVRDRIRVLSLVEFKNAWREAVSKALHEKSTFDKSWIHSIPYKILETPDIHFDIQNIIINKPGRLLAVVGEKDLSVICLPRQNYISSTDVSGRLVDSRSLQIGKKYYGSKSSGILKAEWHPLSETSTHIAVLDCDSTLRMFNIGDDISEPEQTFDLSPADKTNTTRNTGGISLDDDDDDDEDAVAFSFSGKQSEKDNGWESFTMYYALRNGHMYALCPVIPYTSTVQREHLDNLGCIAQVKFTKAENDVPALAYLYQLQCEWIDGLLESAAESNIGRKSINTDVLTVYSKDVVSFEPHRQGPFMVSQAEGLPKHAQVSDIYYTNVDRVGMIVLALSNGTIQNHILASDVEAQWQMPVKTTNEACQKELSALLSTTAFLPRATLYEEINIKPAHFTAQQKLKIVKNNRYQDSYFVYHAGGVTSIVMTEWLKGLKQLIESNEKGNSGGVAEWINNSKGSEATNLIISAPLSSGFVPIIGLANIADHYLSYSLLAVTGDFFLVSRELSLRRTEDNTEEASRAIKAHLNHIGDDQTDQVCYSCLLSLPAFTIPPQLSKLPNQVSIVAPKAAGKEIVINDETTTFFSKYTDQIRRDAHALKKIGGVISNRIVAQQTEFENQVKYTQLLVDRIQSCSSSEVLKAKQEKIKQVTENHAKLQLRMDEYLSQLMDSYQPELSDDEKAWVAKLEELKQKLQDKGGYESRLKLLKEQLTALNEKTSTPSRPVTIPAGMTKAQLQSILRSAKEQSTTIDNVKERIELLTGRFENTKI